MAPSLYHNDSGEEDEDIDKSQNYEEIDFENRSESSDGVKEDLKETLTRQLWGVASFLAPPPPPPPPPPAPPIRRTNSDLNRVDRSGLTDDETEYSVDECLYDAVGITEEVLTFAKNIAHHPETWLDFPIEEDDFDDFEISDAQQKHSFDVERLAPRLAALRIELCPVHMSEGYFWMVYFVLLHTRLNKHDAELLSTPQLVVARAMWLQELQKKTEPDSGFFGKTTFLVKESTYSSRQDFDSTSFEDGHCRYFIPQRSRAFEPTTILGTSDIETEKFDSGSTEVQFIDKVVVEEDPPSKIIEESAAGPSSKPPFLDYDEHEDDWLQDIEESEGYSGTRIPMDNEEISFSDLEDDIDCTTAGETKTMIVKCIASPNTS